MGKDYRDSDEWTRTRSRFGGKMYSPDVQMAMCVYVVTGSPGSGKSYLVNQMATKYDIIFDYDKIAEAMCPVSGLHGNHTYMKNVLLSIRDTVIRCFADRVGEWHNAFFITATPNRNEIEVLVKRMKANELHVDATMEECIEHIRNDETRILKARDIELVRDYFMKTKLYEKK